MKSITLFLCLLFSYNLSTFAQSGNNTVEGTIKCATSSGAIIKKGKSYKGGNTSKSKEKNRIDDQNNPEKNIYISLHPLDFKPTLTPTENIKVTQRAKTFSPNIVAVTKGSTIQFINEDQLYHNVYSLSTKARFNIGRRPTGNVYGQKIKKVGIIKLGCDIHPEMSATILSLDTPYFTKINEDGTYSIKELPDGRYKLQVYHPVYKKYTAELTVKGNQVISKNINLQPKA